VDGIELLLGEAVQVIFAEATVAEQRGEDKRQDGVAEIERTVDAFALLGEPAFDFPQVRSFPDPIGPDLCFPDDGLEFAVQGRSKALRATIFSVDDHFHSLIEVVSEICALIMPRLTFESSFSCLEEA
jgi:hypothetical protein